MWNSQNLLLQIFRESEKRPNLTYIDRRYIIFHTTTYSTSIWSGTFYFPTKIYLLSDFVTTTLIKTSISEGKNLFRDLRFDEKCFSIKKLQILRRKENLVETFSPHSVCALGLRFFAASRTHTPLCTAHTSSGPSLCQQAASPSS